MPITPTADTTPEAGLGRMARKRIRTRAGLLQSAYAVMLRTGIDAATVKDITDHADVGFGTFYNYFDSKDALAARLLDCVIDDLGRRNRQATAAFHDDPLLVIAASTRLVMRDAVTNPIWAWWATRSDLLVDRVREGLSPFARRDIMAGIERRLLAIEPADMDALWSMAVWLMVGGIHDMILGLKSTDEDAFVVAAMMRMLGIDRVEALRIASGALPSYPPPSIDWTFRIALDEPGK